LDSWINHCFCSDICDSQPISPILKLPPPPCAVLLVVIEKLYSGLENLETVPKCSFSAQAKRPQIRSSFSYGAEPLSLGRLCKGPHSPLRHQACKPPPQGGQVLFFPHRLRGWFGLKHPMFNSSYVVSEPGKFPIIREELNYRAWTPNSTERHQPLALCVIYTSFIFLFGIFMGKMQT